MLPSSPAPLLVQLDLRSRSPAPADEASRAAAPVLDAAVVGGEAVVDAPEDRLGAARDVDFSVDHANVGLDGVWAEEGEDRHLRIAPSLGDQCEDLRFAVGEAFSAPRPVQSVRDAGAA